MINKLPHTAEMLRGTAGLVLKNDNLPRTCYTACNDAAHRLEQCHIVLTGIDTVIEGWLRHGHDAEDAMKLIAEILDENNEPE